MPSTRIRLAGEAGFLVLVALGLGLAGFDAVVIAAVMAAALVLVALLERAGAKEAARARTVVQNEAPAPPSPAGDVEPVQPEEPKRVEPEPEPAVSDRSARAILASAPPPLPEDQRKARRAAPPPSPPPEPEPAAEPIVSSPPREWNLWDLQRAVREAADDGRRDEWTALLIHLREFANADGDLPLDFDPLVRESFGPLLARSAEPAATA